MSVRTSECFGLQPFGLDNSERASDASSPCCPRVVTTATSPASNHLSRMAAHSEGSSAVQRTSRGPPGSSISGQGNAWSIAPSRSSGAADDGMMQDDRRWTGILQVMSEPILRAKLDTGDVYDDPSEDALFELLSDIAAGGALWVIVEKIDAVDGQTYAQAIRLEDGSFQVERRLGSPETHETVAALDMRAAHELLTEWAFHL